MILCDICGKSMTISGDVQIPFIYVSGFDTKHACPTCKYEWLATKERIAKNEQLRLWDAQVNAFREFCEIKKPKIINGLNKEIS